jgi:hypothetical protein
MSDNDKFTDSEIWFEKNKDFFPHGFRENLEMNTDTLSFYARTYENTMEELCPQLRNLMMRQFPVLKTDTRPLVLQAISKLIENSGCFILFKLYSLMQDQKNGIDLRKKYPNFNDLLDLHVRPHKPRSIDISFYDFVPLLPTERKKELVDELNRIELRNIKRNERRKFYFFDLIQKCIFKYYPEIQDLDADGWSVYAIYVGMEYEGYRDECIRIGKFIKRELTEESFSTRLSK